jgi:hypothetical protein
MNQIIVTEGKFEKALLESILPIETMSKIKIEAGMGSSSALSLARSYYVNGDNRVLVALDSYTNNEQQIREKKSFTESFLNMYPSNSEMKVVVFIPELEALFFTDKHFIESYFGKNISPTEFELYKRDPEYALEQLSGGKPAKNIRLDILNKIDDSVRKKIIADPSIKEVINYFQ